MDFLQANRRLALDQAIHHIQHRLVGRRPQHCLGHLQRDRFPARGQLVKQRDRIPHRTGRLARHQGQRLRLNLNLLLVGHFLQKLGDLGHQDAPEFMPLATREHRCRDFMHLGCRQDENRMRRRLFQRLQQGIECRRREHVHFVNNINFIVTQVRGKIDLISQIAHVFHAGVGGCVDLNQIDETSLVHCLAVGAAVAWPPGWVFIQAIHRLS